MIWIAVFLGAGLLAGVGLLRRGMRWGSTAEERRSAALALRAATVIDSIMARAQLLGVRERAESEPSGESLETGSRDQYQLYEIVYADGERAGVEGQEAGAKSRNMAIGAGIL